MEKKKKKEKMLAVSHFSLRSVDSDRQTDGETFVSVALIKFAFLLRGGPRSHYRYQFYQRRNVSRSPIASFDHRHRSKNCWSE